MNDYLPHKLLTKMHTNSTMTIRFVILKIEKDKLDSLALNHNEITNTIKTERFPQKTVYRMIK